MIARLLFLAIVSWAPAYGAELFLYNHAKPGTAKDEPVEDSSRVIPNRVYIAYAKLMQRWVFELSDGQGKLPTPIEGLGSGTKLRGALIGAKMASALYKLAEDGTWKEVGANDSDDDDEYFIWIVQSPIRSYTETFRSAENLVGRAEKPKAKF